MDPKKLPKSITNLKKSRSGPQGVLLGVPGAPKITRAVPQVAKMSPQGTKMEPPGLQNYSFGYKKLPISAFYQPAVPCSQRGPAAGGEALRIIN
jgi:hypothetical protein